MKHLLILFRGVLLVSGLFFAFQNCSTPSPFQNSPMGASLSLTPDQMLDAPEIAKRTYLKILDREPTNEELLKALDLLKTSSVSELIVYLFTPNGVVSQKPLPKATSEEISRMYLKLLERSASAQEISYWENLEWSSQDVIRGILGSEEFRNGNLDLLKEVNLCSYGANQDLNAGPSLNACFTMTKTKAILLPALYTLRSNLVLIYRETPFEIVTYGFDEVSDEALTPRPCMGLANDYDDNDSRCARIKASHDNGSGPLLLVKKDLPDSNIQSFKSLKLKYVAFDGNIHERRKHFGTDYWNNQFGVTALRNNQSNVFIFGCNECTFVGVSSLRAVAASGFIFLGERARFHNVLMRDNGNGLNKNPNFGEWADGLTVVSGPGVRITDSRFLNNSDINLIVGNGRQSYIARNIIGVREDGEKNFVFAGLMLDTFQSPANNDFREAVVEHNQIDGGPGFDCGIGIDLGPYFWYSSLTNSAPAEPIIGGTIRNNRVKRARQGIGIYGAHGTTILGNLIADSGGFRLADRNGNLFNETSAIDVALRPDESINLNAGSASVTHNRLVPSPIQSPVWDNRLFYARPASSGP